MSLALPGHANRRIIRQEVRETVYGLRRDLILVAARGIVNEAIENGAGIARLPSGKARGVIVKKALTYSFFTDGRFDLGSHGLVFSETTTIRVPPTLTDTEGAEANFLQSSDLKMIRAGCEIFGASKPIKKALKDIKKRPLKVVVEQPR